MEGYDFLQHMSLSNLAECRQGQVKVLWVAFIQSSPSASFFIDSTNTLAFKNILKRKFCMGLLHGQIHNTAAEKHSFAFLKGKGKGKSQ